MITVIATISYIISVIPYITTVLSFTIVIITVSNTITRSVIITLIHLLLIQLF